MTDLRQRLLDGFKTHFTATPDIGVRSPGRVNLIGEHTDYNDGFVLPAAIGGETGVAIRRRDDRLVNVVALDFDATIDSFRLDQPIGHAARGGWRDYVRGTLAAMIARGMLPMGMDVAIAGNLMRGAGLSSSASLEVAVAGGAVLAAGLDATPTDLARIGQDAENDFVGMRCGIMDQLASAAATPGNALLVDCRSLEVTQVPVPATAALMIIHSGVVRGLVDGEYNRRRAQCEEASAILGVPALRDATPDMLEAARTGMSDIVYRRARHVIAENARTVAAAAALERSDLVAMGGLMRDSHASMRNDFEITVPSIDALVDVANKAIGDVGGARMTGGGFGGAVVALVGASAVADVEEAIVRGYRTPAGDRPRIMVERPSVGFSRLF